MDFQASVHQKGCDVLYRCVKPGGWHRENITFSSSADAKKAVELFNKALKRAKRMAEEEINFLRGR